MGCTKLTYQNFYFLEVVHPKKSASEEKKRVNYYPFGLKHKGYNTAKNGVHHKFEFQGQESQEELDLNWISFKWRNYDPAIGRFFNIDPLSEIYRNWGGYVFSGNRVIDSRELEGLEPHSIHLTQHAAARNFGQRYNGISITQNLEYVARIYSTTDVNGVTTYSYGVPAPGTEDGAKPSQSAIPAGTTYTAYVHTHAAYNRRYANNDFSGTVGSSTDGGDIGYAENRSVDGYVVTPNGSFQFYDYLTNIISTLGRNMPSDPNDPTTINPVPITHLPIVPIPVTPTPIVPIPVTPIPIVPIPVIPTPSPAPLPIIIPPKQIDL